MKRNAVIFLLTVAFSFLLTSPALAEDKKNNILEVTVKGVTLDPLTSKPIVLLEDTDHKRVLPIWIGAFEANLIALGLEHIVTPRPMTHDLIKNILDGIDAKVIKVIITDLKNNVFYSVIFLNIKGAEVTIDSRPSDAIALAVRANAPIFVEEDVMDKAKAITIEPEKSLQTILSPYGLTLQELTPAIAQYFNLTNPKGILISDVQSGSSAESVGIKRGDVLRRIGKESVFTLNDIDRVVGKDKKESSILIDIEREKSFYSFTLKAIH